MKPLKNQSFWISQRRIDYSIVRISLNSVFILGDDCRRLLYSINQIVTPCNDIKRTQCYD